MQAAVAKKKELEELLAQVRASTTELEKQIQIAKAENQRLATLATQGTKEKGRRDHHGDRMEIDLTVSPEDMAEMERQVRLIPAANSGAQSQSEEEADDAVEEVGGRDDDSQPENDDGGHVDEADEVADEESDDDSVELLGSRSRTAGAGGRRGGDDDDNADEDDDDDVRTVD
jgi:hypothetical protein